MVALLLAARPAQAQFAADPAEEPVLHAGKDDDPPPFEQTSTEFFGFQIDPEAHGLLLYPGIRDPRTLADAYQSSGMPWFYPHEVADRLDPQGVPFVEYDFGLHRNPVATAQTALAFHSQYLRFNDRDARVRFLANANWLLANHDDDYYFRYDFRWQHGGRNLPEGWVSAMAQGQALGVLVRAFDLTADSTYLEAARGVFLTLYRNTEDTWTFGVDEDGHYWMEEYPNEDFCHVLNGFLFGLWGLWDYYAVTGDEFALTLFEAGIASIVEHVPDWNLPFINSSFYCLHRVVQGAYHQIHLRQFTAYADFFDIHEFREAVSLYQDTSRPLPILTAAPAELSFGSVEVGQRRVRTIALTNSGQVPLHVEGFAVRGDAFVLPPPTLTILAGMTHHIEVAFMPRRGGAVLDTLFIYSDDAFSPDRVLLHGTGLAAGIAADPEAIDFGNVPFGSRREVEVTLTNTGAAALRITRIETTSPAFAVATPPEVIPPGRGGSIVVGVVPVQPGSLSDTIVVWSNADGSPLRIPVQAHAFVTEARASHAQLEFGRIFARERVPAAFTIENVGSEPLVIAEAVTGNAAFVVEQAPGEVPAGARETVVLSFVPPRQGMYRDALTIRSNSTEPIVVTLEGDARSPVRLKAGPEGTVPVLDFAEMERDEDDRSFVEVENTARSEVPLRPYILSEESAFRLVDEVDRIGAESTVRLHVDFAPPYAGVFADTLVIESEVLSEPLRVPLVGSTDASMSVPERPARDRFALDGNYPNPFRESTQIAYVVGGESDVRLVLYNALGQRLHELVSGTHAPGRYVVSARIADAAAGVYFLRMFADGRLVDTASLLRVR